MLLHVGEKKRNNDVDGALGIGKLDWGGCFDERLPNYAQTRTSSRILTNPCTSSSANKPRTLAPFIHFPERTSNAKACGSRHTGIIMHQTDPHHTLIP